MLRPKSIAIIPARKGSKRLPGKNMRLLGGKPLVQWTIESALASTEIDRILVTSDDEMVLELARTMGVSYIIERPSTLAGDATKTTDVVLHALKEANVMNEVNEAICLLQATSPLRTAGDIDAAFKLYRTSNARPIVSVCELEHPLSWCQALGEGGSMEAFAKVATQQKQHQATYRLNGALYIISVNDFLASASFLTENALAYVMPKNRSTDIDDVFDFYVAEAFIAKFGV